MFFSPQNGAAFPKVKPSRMFRRLPLIAVLTLGCTPSVPQFATSLESPQADASGTLPRPGPRTRLSQSPSSSQGEDSIRRFFALLSTRDLPRLSAQLAPGAEIAQVGGSGAQPAVSQLRELFATLHRGSSSEQPVALGLLEFLSVRRHAKSTDIVVRLSSNDELAGEWTFSLTHDDMTARISHITLPKPR